MASVWMYYETDGDDGYYAIKLFKERIDAEIHMKNINKGYGNVDEIEVHEKEEPQPKKPSIYEEVTCPDCLGPMISRSGQFGTFWGCKRFPNCKGTRDSMGRSKQDRQQESIERSVEGKEWPRNERDKISWNKK